MDLFCILHQEKIIMIDETKDAKFGTRAKCSKCQLRGSFIDIENFFLKLNEIIPIQNQKYKDKLEEFGKLSIPLEKILENYKSEFNSTIHRIVQEVDKIRQLIYDHYSITNKPLESQSLTDFEKICHKVYSMEDLNLNSNYSKIIEAIQNLISMESYYSLKLIKCFKQLQNDMVNYKHQYSFNVPERKLCTAMCMGKEGENQIIALALANKLKTYEFNLETKKANEIQTFQDFIHNIGSLVISEDNQFLIVGGTFDKKMKIYKEGQTKKHYEFKIEILFGDPIYSVIFSPNDEELILASGNDLYCLTNQDIQSIIQQEKKIIGQDETAQNYQLETSHSNTVYQISHDYNKIKQKLISCSYDKMIFIWKKVDKWYVINRIKVKNCVYRCCFIGEDNIAVQENSSRHLTFYNNVSSKQYNTNQNLQFYDLNTDISHNFPMMYLENLKLLVVKHNSKIVFFKKRKNDIFYKEAEIDGEIGTLTADGELFLKWDNISQKVEIHKQTKFELTKDEVEAKFYKSLHNQNSNENLHQSSIYLEMNRDLSQMQMLDKKYIQNNYNKFNQTKEIGINTDDNKPILNMDESQSSIIQLKD